MDYVAPGDVFLIFMLHDTLLLWYWTYICFLPQSTGSNGTKPGTTARTQYMYEAQDEVLRRKVDELLQKLNESKVSAVYRHLQA